MNADFLWLSLKMKFSYIEDIPTPCYVVDTGRLEQNARTIHHVQEETGAKGDSGIEGICHVQCLWGAEKISLWHDCQLGP